MFGVIVMPNLYSDVAAQITGSVDLGPSADTGDIKARTIRDMPTR